MSEHPARTETEIVDFIRSIDVAAPEALRERIDALIDERPARAAGQEPVRGRATRRVLAGTLAIAAILLVAVILSSRGGSPAPPTVQATAALTLRPATMPAPVESARQGGALRAAVDGVAFPYWEDRFGWRAIGARTDHLEGHAVTTVFYAHPGGGRIGYAILGGSPPSDLGAGWTTWRDGTAFHALTLNGQPAVVWLRDGHLCVLHGRGVSTATLLQLASSDASTASA